MTYITHRPDLLEVLKYEIVLDHSKTLEQLNAEHEMRQTSDMPKTPMSKEFAGNARREHQRWHEYTTGNAYVLYVQNRTSSHAFRVVAYGSTPVDAVKRWYRGLDGNDKQKRTAVCVIAVHACADTSTTEAGDLLMGTPQPSYPY